MRSSHNTVCYGSGGFFRLGAFGGMILGGLISLCISPVNAGDLDPTSDPDLIPSVDTVLVNYRLAWSDEFNGTEIDEAKWGYRTDSKHWSTQKPENVSVSHGVARIALKREMAAGKQYTGGGLISRGYFGYGYYEARLAVPSSAGWHTSFWMMDSEHINNDRVSSQVELDPFENDSVDLHKYSTDFHQWRSPLGHVKRWRAVETDESLDDFNVIGMEWTPDEVRYYFNGRLVYTTDVLIEQLSGQERSVGVDPRRVVLADVEHNNVQIWFTSIASWLGNTDAVDESSLPNEARCDYVRYFMPNK